jgi:Peptidase MA superfamily
LSAGLDGQRYATLRVILVSVWLSGLVLAAPIPKPAAAQGGIQVIEAPAPLYDFGGPIAFHLTAESTANIDSATLFINTGGLTPATWRSAPFQPAQHVEAVVSFDLALNPLPPFGPVNYWWQIADKAGQTLTTPPASFNYEDNRFAWRTVSRGSVTVHWYRGDPSFGQEAADIASNALPTITQDVRAPLPEHVNVYIYATDSDVQSALGRVGIAYANGHADPKLSVVIISVAPDLRASYNLQIQLPHEMTHVLIYRASAGNYARVPYWFNEGLAVMHQAQRDSNFPALLAAARDSRQFLSLSSLCAPFNPAQVSLAYAESESAVRYIRERYGAEGINRLLTTYAGGADCAAGVQSSLGLSLDQLQADWQQNLAPAPLTVQERAQALAPWLLLAALVLLAPFTLLLAAIRRRPATLNP